MPLAENFYNIDLLLPKNGLNFLLYDENYKNLYLMSFSVSYNCYNKISLITNII